MNNGSPEGNERIESVGKGLGRQARRLRAGTQAQDLAEYAILISIIAVALIAGITLIGGRLVAMYTAVAGRL